MTTAGWIFMLSTWGVVIAVTGFCIRRLLKN